MASSRPARQREPNVRLADGAAAADPTANNGGAGGAGRGRAGGGRGRGRCRLSLEAAPIEGLEAHAEEMLAAAARRRAEAAEDVEQRPAAQQQQQQQQHVDEQEADDELQAASPIARQLQPPALNAAAENAEQRVAQARRLPPTVAALRNSGEGSLAKIAAAAGNDAGFIRTASGAANRPPPRRPSADQHQRQIAPPDVPNNHYHYRPGTNGIPEMQDLRPPVGLQPGSLPGGPASQPWHGLHQGYMQNPAYPPQCYQLPGNFPTGSAAPAWQPQQAYPVPMYPCPGAHQVCAGPAAGPAAPTPSTSGTPFIGESLQFVGSNWHVCLWAGYPGLSGQCFADG